MTAETFKLSGGSVASNSAAIVSYLGAIGLTATASGGVVTFSTLSQLAGSNKQRQWAEVLRIADANGGYVNYTASS